MPDAYSQDTGHIKIESPLGPDTLLATSFTGRERLSTLFEYGLEAISLQDDLDYSKIVGKLVSVGIRHTTGKEELRWFSGHVMRFSAAGFEKEGRVYRAVLVPWTWFLTCSSDCRIFQDMKVPDIVEKVLREHGSDFELRLTGTYDVREYCVQYNELDFAFVSRLMEECGIYYYFEQGKAKHTMVLSDDRTKFGTCEEKEVPFRQGEVIENSISVWDHQYEFRPGKFTYRDYHFHTPATKREKSEPATLKTSDKSKHELYEYPGGYARASDKGNPLVMDALFTRVRMEAEETPHNVVQGTSTCLTFEPGRKFKLTDHMVKAENGEYVFTAIDFECSGHGGGLGYGNSFRCIPSDVIFRPERVTPRPRVRGVQTAVVVGPSGEEIYVDDLGRVKVQFHWDRDGKQDESSSCWIRVAQSSAGKTWGIVFHPRIGQEVVVSFLEGDPDRPLVTGVVYNADQMPPYVLPDNKNKSVVKSHSTLKGDDTTFNELYFDDTKGEEEIYFHAEKNFNRVVENDDTLKVGFDDKDKGDQTIDIFNNQDIKIGTPDAADGSQTLSIFKNQTIDIGVEGKDGTQKVTIHTDRTIELKEGDDTLKVTTGKRTITIKGNHTRTVEQGDEKVVVKQGKQSIEVMGDQSIKIKTGNHKLDVAAGKSLYKAMQKIEIKCGASSITLDPVGVTIKGTMIKIIANAIFDAKGSAMAKVTGGGMLQLKGGIAMIN